jgi:hypothetical protein
MFVRFYVDDREVSQSRGLSTKSGLFAVASVGIFADAAVESTYFSVSGGLLRPRPRGRY